jgi:tripartite-type tricarboxylate transporter receptor subunit TctC
MCGNIANSVARAAAKQSKPLALLSRERTPLMPKLATAHEQGITDYDVVTWTAGADQRSPPGFSETAVAAP